MKGETVQFGELRFKRKDVYGLQLTFSSTSKIRIKPAEKPLTLATNLKDLDDLDQGKHFSIYFYTFLMIFIDIVSEYSSSYSTCIIKT